MLDLIGSHLCRPFVPSLDSESGAPPAWEGSAPGTSRSRDWLKNLNFHITNL